ncbi:MAG: SMP-30/gluconolactonase/LRE family protein [Pseudomonadota bacterium]
MKIQKTILSLLALYMTFITHAVFAGSMSVSENWTLAEGLNKPESVVYDEKNKVLYISNINGKGREKNGLGYIAKVSPDGKIILKEWVKDLNAPKGLALSNGKLYIADIDALIVVDVETATVEKRYEAEGAKFLNDVAINAKGKVYVSDSKTSKIHILEGDKFSVWLDDERVLRANGLYALEGDLLIAAGDSSHKKPHKNRYLQLVSYDKKTIRPIKDQTSLGDIDGVVPDGNNGIFLTDWRAGKLMHYSKDKGAILIKQLGKGTADLTYVGKSKLIYLPVMMSHELKSYSVTFSE